MNCAYFRGRDVLKKTTCSHCASLLPTRAKSSFAMLAQNRFSPWTVEDETLDLAKHRRTAMDVAQKAKALLNPDLLHPSRRLNVTYLRCNSQDIVI